MILQLFRKLLQIYTCLPIYGYYFMYNFKMFLYYLKKYIDILSIFGLIEFSFSPMTNNIWKCTMGPQ